MLRIAIKLIMLSIILLCAIMPSVAASQILVTSSLACSLLRWLNIFGTADYIIPYDTQNGITHHKNIKLRHLAQVMLSGTIKLIILSIIILSDIGQVP